MLKDYIPKIINEFNDTRFVNVPNYINQPITTSDKVNREYDVIDTNCTLKLTNGRFVEVYIMQKTPNNFVCSVTDNIKGAEHFDLNGNKNKWFTKIKKNVENMGYSLFDIEASKKKVNNYIEKLIIE